MRAPPVRPHTESMFTTREFPVTITTNPLPTPPVQQARAITWSIRALAVLALLALLSLAVPLIFGAVAAGAGMLVLGMMALAALALVQALPLLGQKLENRLLAARRQEARRNPIEQMQNQLLRRTEQLRSFRTGLAGVQAQIESLQENVLARQRQAPEHDLRKMETLLDRMRVAYGANVQRLAAAEKALGEFEQHVSSKRFEYQCAMELERINASLHGTDASRVLDQMLSDEATLAVQSRFNQAFAELELDQAMTALSLQESAAPLDSALHKPGLPTTRTERRLT